jgi:hypothetical protein
MTKRKARPRSRSQGGVFAYEHSGEPLLPPAVFLQRIGRHLLLATAFGIGALALGVLGYRWTEGMYWLDSYLNASMILGGMGPVAELHTRTGKVFAGTYALFSGLVFIGVGGVIVAPFAHRLLHKLHMDDEPS